MKVSIVAAVAKNGVIGIENRLPWHLPEDLAFFKKTTLGYPVLMGRKTYESINRPLPGRLNVILSSQADWQAAPSKDGTPRSVISHPSPLPSGGTTQIAKASNLPNALKWLNSFEQVFLIGGSHVYQQALEQKLVDELILTEIHENFKGDAYFPEWDRKYFAEIDRISNPASAERAWGFDFVKYQRI